VREGGIAQVFEEFEHLLGLRAAGLAFEFAMIGLAGIEKEQRVAGGRGVEHDEAFRALADFAGKGAEHGDFLGAGRAQVFFEQGAAGGVHLSALICQDLGCVGGGFGSGIDLAEREAVQPPSERLRDVRGGIGGAEMDAVTAFREQHGDSGGDRRFADAAFAHGHDDAVALLLDAVHEIGEALHLRRVPIRRDGGNCGGFGFVVRSVVRAGRRCRGC
jgi:hypothetical protein